MTYRGARVLKKRQADRSARLMSNHVIGSNIYTHDPLVAETIGGRKMNVTLTGENLHYNDNCLYWSEKRFRKFEAAKKNSSGQKRSSIESFDESEVDCEVHEEVEQLRNCIPEGERIGFLGINRASDYR